MCLALTLSLLITGCGGEKPPAAPAAADGSLRLTQVKTVKKQSFAKKTRYAEFLSAAEPRFVVPGLAQGLTPQGIAYSAETGLVYISAYAAEGGPSVIAAVSPETGELKAAYFLFNEDKSPFTGHMGGIAATRSCLYFSARAEPKGTQRIACLPFEKLRPEGSHEIVVKELIDVPIQPSFLSCSEGVLRVGNFYHPEEGYGLPPEMQNTVQGADGEQGAYIFAYEVGENGGRLSVQPGDKYPTPAHIVSVPDKIQGAAFAGGKAYLSRSYGRKNDSALLCYDLSLNEPPDADVLIFGQSLPLYILDSRRLAASVTAMPMAEGLAMTKNGKLLMLFESGAFRYKNGKNRTDRVWEFTP